MCSIDNNLIFNLNNMEEKIVWREAVRELAYLINEDEDFCEDMIYEMWYTIID